MSSSSHSPLSTLFPYTTLFRSGHSQASQPQGRSARGQRLPGLERTPRLNAPAVHRRVIQVETWVGRSEEHTSELQSPCNLVCRLLLEKQNIIIIYEYDKPSHLM